VALVPAGHSPGLHPCAAIRVRRFSRLRSFATLAPQFPAASDGLAPLRGAPGWGTHFRGYRSRLRFAPAVRSTPGYCLATLRVALRVLPPAAFMRFSFWVHCIPQGCQTVAGGRGAAETSGVRGEKIRRTPEGCQTSALIGHISGPTSLHSEPPYSELNGVAPMPRRRSGVTQPSCRVNWALGAVQRKSQRTNVHPSIPSSTSRRASRSPGSRRFMAPMHAPSRKGAFQARPGALRLATSARWPLMD
jgi:hypothetical protein